MQKATEEAAQNKLLKADLKEKKQLDQLKQTELKQIHKMNKNRKECH